MRLPILQPTATSATQVADLDFPVSASSVNMLQQGLNYARLGYAAEAAAFFRHAQQQLAQDDTQLAIVLAALLQTQLRYQQNQQALLQASASLADTAEEYEQYLAELERNLAAPVSPPTPLEPVQAGLSVTKPPENLNEEGLPSLYATCFGRFELKRQGQPVTLCPNRNGQTILRYLINQPEQRAASQTLMAALWPDDESEVARHKLQVAVSALRRALNQGFECAAGEGYILCKGGYYQINPAIKVETDSAEFTALYQAGRQLAPAERARYYTTACRLYTGPFLSEDLYSDWAFMTRERLNLLYLEMARALVEYHLSNQNYEAAIEWASKLVAENRCDEAAHQLLMQAYALSGNRSAALRQYQHCQQILHDELKVPPLPETDHLYQTIKNGLAFAN